MGLISRKKAALVFALALTIAIISPVALFKDARATETGIYFSSNGWQLEYNISESITINGVITQGEGELFIPSTINGQKVTKLADGCFKNQEALEEISLPETLTDLGRSCFESSGISSIKLPMSIQYIPAYCFRNCSELKSVDIEASELQYISLHAFSGCSELESLQIPPLTSHVPYEDRIAVDKDFPLGNYCFMNCTNLKSIEFLGSVAQDISYFCKDTCLDGCDNLESLVYHTKKSTIPSGMSSTDSVANTFYFSLDFYNSEQDANNNTNRLGSVTYSWNVKMIDILNRKADPAESWKGLSEIPEPPNGKVWGIIGHALESPDSTLNNSYKVVACNPENLSYGFVCSAVIQDFLNSSTNTISMNSQSYPAYYFDASGNAIDLDEICAYGPTGVKLDSSCYTLVYKKGTYVNKNWEWSEVDPPLKEAGTYYVVAQGVGEFSNTKTSSVTFTLDYYSPTNKSYSGQYSSYLGTIAADSMALSNNQSLYSVIVPEDDWRYQLIGVGLAGVGDANVIYDCKNGWNKEAVRAFSQAKATSVQIVGSTSKVPESENPEDEAYLVDILNERNLRYATRYSDDSTIQALARSVYTSIRDQHVDGNDVWGAGWGTSAIIVPETQDVDILPIAQLAYCLDAPVFFAQSDGTLDPKTLKYLISDGFEKVYIAGSTSLISTKTESQIKSLAFVETERILSGNSSSGEICVNFASMIDSLRGEAPEGVVIASTERDSNVTCAAQLAALTGSSMLTCSSEADSKLIQAKIQDYMSANGFLSISNVYFVGDFSTIDSSLADRISRIWNSPMSVKSAIGDSREVGNLIYKFNSNGTASLLRVRNKAITSISVASVRYEGKSYPITSVVSIDGPNVEKVVLGKNVSTVSREAFSKATSLKSLTVKAATSKMLSGGAFTNASSLTTLALTSNTIKVLPVLSFAGCSNLKTLTLSTSALSSIKSGAFSGCTNLSGVKITSSKLKTLTSGMFAGCSNLKTLTLSTSALSSIKSGAFSGCTNLSRLKITSPKLKKLVNNSFKGAPKLISINLNTSNLKTINAKAFSGCKKVKTLTINSSKIKTVSKKAFSYINSKAKIKVPKKKVKTYKKLFLKHGLSLKAKVVKC